MQADDTSAEGKRHAACDECRKRKLKCSGEPLGCSRCTKQGLVCVYSIQKQMGRPRKRQQSDNVIPSLTSQDSSASSISNTPFHDVRIPNLTLGEHIDPEVWANFISLYMPPPGPPIVPRIPLHVQHQLPFTADTNQMTQPQGPDRTNGWSRYGSFEYPPASDGFPPAASSSSDSGYSASTNCGGPVNGLTCACLPNLYLSLSALSSLQSFPISPPMLETIQTAAHTAHSVTYCRICPRNFQAGVQNIMMLGTLLTTLTDSWSRILHATPFEFWQGFYFSVDIASEEGMPKRPWDDREEPYWRLWSRQLVYKNVFGSDYPHPIQPIASADSTEKVELTLNFIIDAMERRQKMWHDEIPTTEEFMKTQSFGPVYDAMRAMMNNQVPDNNSRVTAPVVGEHQHHHQGHKPMPGNPNNPDQIHFCQQVARNARKIMNGMAYIMNIPQRNDT